MDHVFEALQEFASRFPSSIALASRAGYMTYEDFVGNISSAAYAAAKNGIKPGQLVVLAGANHDAQLMIALALIRIGCRVGYARQIGLYESNGVSVDAVIADAALPALKQRVITISKDWFRGSDAIRLTLPRPATDFSMILSSSGSTGKPKLIEVERKAILHRLSTLASETHYNSRMRFLSAMGARSNSHIFRAFAVVRKGGMIIGPSDRSGSTILDTIQLFRPTFALMPPSTLVDILQILDKKPRVMDKVGLVLTSGARATPEVQQAALDRLTEEFISYYGSTETHGLAWGYSKDVVVIDGCVGRVADGLDVAAFSSGGQRLSPGTEGEIRANGAGGIFAKYIGDYGQGQSAFKDGWFATGDIGLVDKDRNLIIRGRASNVINVGGSKASPELLEEDIRAFSQVRDVGVSGVDLPEGFHEICAAIVSNSKLSVDDVNRHLKRRKAQWPVDRVKIVPAIPKTETGKIDRVALKRLCSEQN
jgi:acyl-coenzyme A synthetase/AMP-(fatty) acid ligase